MKSAHTSPLELVDVFALVLMWQKELYSSPWHDSSGRSSFIPKFNIPVIRYQSIEMQWALDW